MINFPFYYAAINTSINTSSNNKYILCSWYNTIWFNPVWFNPVWFNPVWHDRVYLCYEDTKFKSILFNPSIQEAAHIVVSIPAVIPILNLPTGWNSLGTVI